MESLSLKEENITKNIRNLFKVKKRQNYTAIKDIRNVFRTVRVNNFWSNNYIQYESNGDRNKTLSIEEYLN